MVLPECNICGNKEFADFRSRVKAKCTNCRSLERTRLLWMFLEEVNWSDHMSVLHLAPERGLYHRLKKQLKPGRYVCADVDPSNYSFASEIEKIDLTDLALQKSEQYDIILHSHVMEHVPCNIAYTLFHLHRMLKPNGYQLCIIPFVGGKYDECFQDIPDQERVRRFGQNDHVRRFGKDDVDRHLGSIVRLPPQFDALEKFGIERLQRAQIPKTAWRGFTTNTVLKLAKNDFLLR